MNNAEFANWLVPAVLFISILLVAYLVGMSIVNLVDNKLGEIQIKIPKINVNTHLDLNDEHGLLRIHPNSIRSTHTSHSKCGESIDHFNDITNTPPHLTHFISNASDPAPLSQEDEDIPDVQVDREFHMIQVPKPRDTSTIQIKPRKVVKKIGCTKDQDCNIVNGDGLNVCKSDGSCHCLSGSGPFCQYGPTNYKDPKDMTDKERRIFKYQFRNDFTLQDYRNWLMLYKNDPQHLRENHRDNLARLLRGDQLDIKDLPNIRIKPPMDPADYFAKMYEGGKISVHFPAESETGAMLPYNYGKYSEFISPERAQKSWITGVVDLYKRPLKDNAREVNFYLRPEVTVGVERELVGEEYLNWVKRHHNLADIRKIQIRQDESIKTFQSSDKDVKAPT